jgi:hemerythrin-like domain-containing protein
MDELETPFAVPKGSDLALELYREHTLLSVLAARMRETADGIERTRRFDASRMKRGLDVHRRFVLEVHLPNDERVQEYLRRVRDPAVRRTLDECRAQHEKSREFPARAEALAREVAPGGGEAARRLSELYREEADRLEKHHAQESEVLYANLDRRLAPVLRRRLLGQILKVDASRIGGEVALIAWASQLHPAAE